MIIMYLLTGYALFCAVADGLTKLKEKLFPADAEPDEPEQEDEIFTEYSFVSVCEQLTRIQQTVSQLEEVENLITDMEIASPDRRELPLQMTWADNATGQQHTYNFWADGRASTRLLIETAYQEREQLRSSLSEQIRQIYSTVVTETVTESVPENPERGVLTRDK